MVVNQTFQIQSDTRPTFHDVTDKVEEEVKNSGIKNGSVLVFSQHTTCSVLIQEQSDDVNYYGTQFILQDLVMCLIRLYLHAEQKDSIFIQDRNTLKSLKEKETKRHAGV